MAKAKCAGPASVMVFLGFKLDSAQNCPAVGRELERTIQLVREWTSKKACKKRDFESLLGHLQHAAMVVHP